MSELQITMVPDPDGSYKIEVLDKTVVDGRPRVNGMIIADIKSLGTKKLSKGKNLSITIDANRKIVLSDME